MFWYIADVTEAPPLYPAYERWLASTTRAVAICEQSCALAYQAAALCASARVTRWRSRSARAQSQALKARGLAYPATAWRQSPADEYHPEVALA
jgi:hypothetical protein